MKEISFAHDLTTMIKVLLFCFCPLLIFLGKLCLRDLLLGRMCILTTLNQGLRNGGGIGDVLRQPSSEEPLYLLRCPNWLAAQ
jgi:hypothetical protein